MRITSLSLFLLTTLAGPAASLAEMAGVSAAVRGRVELTRTSQQVVGRQVESGENIFLRDRIESGARSGMQIMLLDETIFTIGPESAIEIDEFVYDPSTGAGEVTAEVVTGVFRFVTGRVAEKEPEAMSVKLPVGNIGIRGTMVAGIARPDRSALAFLLGTGPDNDSGDKAGAFVAENAGESRWVRTPGWGAEFYPGEPPRIVKVDPKLIARITGLLGNPEQTDWTELAGFEGPADGATATELSGRDTAVGAGFARLGLSRLGALGALGWPSFYVGQDAAWSDARDEFFDRAARAYLLGEYLASQRPKGRIQVQLQAGPAVQALGP